MPIVTPLILLLGGATAVAIVLATSGGDRPVPDHPPELPTAPPGQTRWKLVNAILDELKKASMASGIPLGLLVGWIAKESGGKLATKPQPGPADTKMGERGLFQLTPEESAKLHLDHERLSTDQMYSINAGLLLIGARMRDVDALSIAPRGTSFYWRMVKLAHTMGAGAMDKIVAMARAAGAPLKTWAQLEEFALAHESEILHAVKHSPSKWFPFVDAVYDVGAPFGFGDATAIVGAAFNDIVDPLDCLKNS